MRFLCYQIRPDLSEADTPHDRKTAKNPKSRSRKHAKQLLPIFGIRKIERSASQTIILPLPSFCRSHDRSRARGNTPLLYRRSPPLCRAFTEGEGSPFYPFLLNIIGFSAKVPRSAECVRKETLILRRCVSRSPPSASQAPARPFPPGNSVSQNMTREALSKMRKQSHFPPGPVSVEDVMRVLDQLERRTPAQLLLLRELRRMQRHDSSPRFFP